MVNITNKISSNLLFIFHSADTTTLLPVLRWSFPFLNRHLTSQ